MADNITKSTTTNSTTPIKNSGWDNSYTKKILNYAGAGLKGAGVLAMQPLKWGLEGISGAENVGRSLFFNPTSDITAGNITNQMKGLGYTDAYNLADKSGVLKNKNNVLRLNDDGSYSIYNSETGTAYGDDVVLGTQGGDFNFGKSIGSLQNIVNLGKSGWGLYETIAGYQDRKDLMKKNLEYADQMLTDNREKLAHLRKERARQDTMRSNVSAQRSSESSVRSF